VPPLSSNLIALPTTDDNPLLNNTIHPTASFDTIDSKTRPTSCARQNSLSGPIIHRGTSLCMSIMCVCACPMYPYVYHVCWLIQVVLVHKSFHWSDCYFTIKLVTVIL